jgi:type IV pilus assembly protein PilO
MKNFLEELKNINPKTPGSWPLPIKFTAFGLILVGVVAIGAVFDWQDEWDQLTTIRETESRLKDEFKDKKKQAINLDLIKKQLIETQQAFGALLKQLPTKSEMAALLTDINQAGLGRGLLFDLFRPGNEAVTGEFTEQPITIRVTGSYDDLGRFSSDIATMPRIVTLNDIAITPVKDGLLAMDAIAKTYRYLDEAELMSQKKPVGAKK